MERLNNIVFNLTLLKFYLIKKPLTFRLGEVHLWESDIEKRLDICEKLISEYVKNNGKLDDYHSFNYHLDNEGNLQLYDNIITPYQYLPVEERKKILK